MWLRGMSTPAITGQLHKWCSTDVSPDLISTVTNAVQEENVAWQLHLQDPAYLPVFLDAIRVKIDDEGSVRNNACGA